MFCSKCGKEIGEGMSYCANCGSPVATSNTVNPVAPIPVNQPKPAATPAPKSNDAPNIGYAILGFFMPIVGLILYLVEKDKSPLAAKSALKGMLIGIAVSVVLFILYVIFIVVIFGMASSSTPYPYY
ncbi:MAG: zinc-ribbon domain-containing protein [Clostridia bacterium]|nr:zinc-ribbon domain-containing protein [Clostridia bacterium]